MYIDSCYATFEVPELVPVKLSLDFANPADNAELTASIALARASVADAIVRKSGLERGGYDGYCVTAKVPLELAPIIGAGIHELVGLGLPEYTGFGGRLKSSFERLRLRRMANKLLTAV